MGLFRRKKPATQPTKIETIADKMTPGIAREVLNRSSTVIKQLKRVHGVTEEELRQAARKKFGL